MDFIYPGDPSTSNTSNKTDYCLNNDSRPWVFGERHIQRCSTGDCAGEHGMVEGGRESGKEQDDVNAVVK